MVLKNSGVLATIRAVALSLLLALKPSFLHRNSTSNKPRRIYRTSYLDGLRGVAALFVVIAHYEATYFPFLAGAFHEGKPKEARAKRPPPRPSNNNLLQLPIVRTIYSGPFMVSIFFVISGYVLSQKALDLSRRRQYSDLLKSLASSVFRRWFRLMLPAIASSFLFFLCVRFNWITILNEGWGATRPPKAEQLFFGEDRTFKAWFLDVLNLVNLFRFGKISFPLHNYPLWTMPVEYMGSMVLFTVLTGTSMLRPIVRKVALAVLSVYCLTITNWEWALFISGALIADIHLKGSPEYNSIPMLPMALRVDEEIAEDMPDNTRPRRKMWMKTVPKPVFYIVDTFLFLFALYLGSVPTGMQTVLAVSPGYSWLAPFVPTSWVFYMGYFYPAVGAIMLVFVLARSEFHQAIFTTRFAQYLGDISLSLYMLHVTVLHTLANWLIVNCTAMMSPYGSWGFTAGISSLMGSGIVTFWVGDIFWRVVDTPCVEFTRWLAEKAFVRDAPSL